MSERPVYKLRRSGSQSSGYRYEISVPPEIGQLIPEGMRFVFETTERGFSYAPLEEGPPEGLPEWLSRLIEEDR